MKKGLFTLLMVAITALTFVAVGALTAADVPDEIKIENEGYASDKKGGVKFHHKKHNVDYKVACTDCHHDYKDGKNAWKEGDPVKKCSGCHNPEKKEGKVDKLQNAYHKNCKNCHKTLEGKNAPFKKCNDCHEKKSK